MPTTKGPRVTVTFDPEPAELARRGRRVAGELFSLFLGDLEDKLFPQLLEKLIQQRTKFGKDTDYNGHDGIYIPERDGGEDRGVAERAAMRGQGVLRMAQNRRGGNGSGTGSSVVWWGRATSDFGGSAKNHRPPRGASRGRLRPASVMNSPLFQATRGFGPPAPVLRLCGCCLRSAAIRSRGAPAVPLQVAERVGASLVRMSSCLTTETRKQ